MNSFTQRRWSFVGIYLITVLPRYGVGLDVGHGDVALFDVHEVHGNTEPQKISYFENRIKKGKPISERNYERAKKEKKELFDYRADVRDAAKTKSGLGTFSRPNMKDVSGNGGGGTSTGSPTNVGNPLGYRYGGIISL